MIATRWGKCEECGVHVETKREFLPQLDMFAVSAPTGITKEMCEQIIAFRDEPSYCYKHMKAR